MTAFSAIWLTSSNVSYWHGENGIYTHIGKTVCLHRQVQCNMRLLCLHSNLGWWILAVIQEPSGSTVLSERRGLLAEKKIYANGAVYFLDWHRHTIWTIWQQSMPTLTYINVMSCSPFSFTSQHMHAFTRLLHFVSFEKAWYEMRLNCKENTWNPAWMSY